MIKHIATLLILAAAGTSTHASSSIPVTVILKVGKEGQSPRKEKIYSNVFGDNGSPVVVYGDETVTLRSSDENADLSLSVPVGECQPTLAVKQATNEMVLLSRPELQFRVKEYMRCTKRFSFIKVTQGKRVAQIALYWADSAK